MHKKLRRLLIMLVAVMVWTLGVALDSHDALAWEKQRGLSQTEIKEKARAVRERAKARWESLTPEEQAYMKERAAQAKMTAKDYWNSLSAEEQQRLLEGKERVSEKAREWWKKKAE